VPATEDYPEEARFRWNIEIAWAFENYVKSRPENKVRELVELIKAGRVELGAWYVQLSDAFAHEELIRAAARAKELGRDHGFKVTCAMNNDVTGFSWAVPQILVRAGVPYFATGINETRAFAPLERPGAFYWESPDGSRVLHGTRALSVRQYPPVPPSGVGAQCRGRDYLAGSGSGGYPTISSRSTSGPG
jgi:hypothetical protein